MHVVFEELRLGVLYAVCRFVDKKQLTGVEHKITNR